MLLTACRKRTCRRWRRRKTPSQPESGQDRAKTTYLVGAVIEGEPQSATCCTHSISSATSRKQITPATAFRNHEEPFRSPLRRWRET